MSLGMAVAVFALQASGADGAPKPLDAATRAHLAAERFSEVRQVAKLPGAVQEELARRLSGGIADAGQPFQETDVVREPGLPHHRLVVAAVSGDHCIVHYESGGIALFRSLMILSWETDKATVVWEGPARRPLATAAQIEAALRDGSLYPSKSR